MMTDRPLVTNFKPVRGTRFTESLTYSFFKEVFLPQGFPKTVHKDYVAYQIWDTLQVRVDRFCIVMHQLINM